MKGYQKAYTEGTNNPHQKKNSAMSKVASGTSKDVATPNMKADTSGYKTYTDKTTKTKNGGHMSDAKVPKKEYNSISDLRVRYKELMKNEGRGTGTY